MDEDESNPELTALSLFTLDYISAPDELTDFVTTFYHFRCDESRIRDIQPAAVGHLIVFLRGEGVMHFAGGYSEPSHRVSVMTPGRAASPIEIDGPFHCVGAALSPLGWASLTGLPAGASADHLIAARDVFGPQIDTLGDAMIADYRAGRADGEELCARLASFVASKLAPVNPRHVALMRAVSEWLSQSLSPPVEALYGLSNYSPRQTQRLVERYFGLPPRELMRKYRALRVVALLNQPEVDMETISLLEDQFYDQSHMIREIRQFAGRTPGRLVGGDESILSALLDLRNFREIKPKVAPLPDGFGSANDSQ
ncbi:MAG: helix-turn-helix domain-containing protein [Sphingomonadaceae bacterium]